MSKEVAIFFFRPWLGAGSTTYTAHLYKALTFAGHKPTIYRIMEFPQAWVKPFGKYDGVEYRITNFQEARKIVASQPSLMSASATVPHIRDGLIEKLMELGMRPVIHDDRDVSTFDWSKAKRPICVREAVTNLIPGSVYLPQPYMRARKTSVGAEADAVSLARVAASKRTTLILEANRILPIGQRIDILGMEDRMYSKQLHKDYADVYARAEKGGLQFPLSFDAPVTACRGAKFNVDMSYFERDGGGTQYAQLEAMDAGVVNIMHKDWFRFAGDMKEGVHALTADSVESLASVVQNGEVGNIKANCDQLLLLHSASRIGMLYMQELLKS